MPTQTSTYGLNKPLVNSATDQDLWGGYLNGDLDSVDALLLTAINWAISSQTSSFNVTAYTTGTTSTGNCNTLFLCDATSGAIVPTLPAAASSSGMMVAFKKSDSSANTITVTGYSAETIDGSNTVVLTTQYNYLIIVCNGTSWNVLAETPVTSHGALLNIQTFTTSGTYTPTAGTNTVKITAIGGGGGSGGSTSGGGDTGGNGGTTSVGTLISCGGGQGGGSGNNTSPQAGGSGGTVSTATIKLIGSCGGPGGDNVSGYASGSSGGAGLYGSGAGQGMAGAANTGAGGGISASNGSIYNGAGGGGGGIGITYASGISGTYTVTIGIGGTAGANGGNAGGTGFVIIEEYS